MKYTIWTHSRGRWVPVVTTRDLPLLADVSAEVKAEGFRAFVLPVGEVPFDA